MDRVVRLYQLWSWLPHFRAVAETEHLPTASDALGISPSSLSRALKQLEGALDRELFERDGRNIRLNHNGKQLLLAVRTAMRGIDDAIAELVQQTAALPLRIAAPGPIHAAAVLTVTESVAARHPRLAFELSSCSNEDMVPSLCAGRIDVCLHEGPIEHPDLQSVLLAAIPKCVAASAAHPLSELASVSVSDLAGHAFAGPPPDERGIRADGWPVGVERSVGLTVSHMQMGIDACASGRYLAVLPLPVIKSAGLQTIEIDGVSLDSVELYATTRAKVESRPREFDDFMSELANAFTVG